MKSYIHTWCNRIDKQAQKMEACLLYAENRFNKSFICQTKFRHAIKSIKNKLYKKALNDFIEEDLAKKIGIF